MTKLRQELLRQARSLVFRCERDYEDAQSRLDNAKAILAHLEEGKPVEECPLPHANDSARPAMTCATRVDVLIMLAAAEQGSEAQ